MYVPEHFALGALHEQHAVIAAHDFGLLVSPVEGEPFASHLPFELDPSGGPQGTLRAHVSRSNPHWRGFDGERDALAIFSGPHAYVSPRWYPEGPNLPTWNYVAVHVYGRPKIVEDEQVVRAHLEQLVSSNEGTDGWSLGSQKAKFLEGMRQGIVVFEIAIDRIEAKAKLGQNHSEAKRRGSMEGLVAERGDDREAVAGWMTRQIAGELD